jgi:hypothetical protein
MPREEIGERAAAANVSDAMLGRLKRDLRIRHRVMRGESEGDGGRPRFLLGAPRGRAGAAAVRVEELIKELGQFDPGAEVRMAQQPAWPFE